jgi:hypothetical protein
MNSETVQMRPTEQQMFIRELPALKGKFLYPELEEIDREETEIQRHPEIHEPLSRGLTSDIEFTKTIDAGVMKLGGVAAFLGFCAIASSPITGCLILGGAAWGCFISLGSDKDNEKAFREITMHRLNRLSNKIERIKAIAIIKGPIVGENQAELAVNGLETLKNRCFFLSEKTQIPYRASTKEEESKYGYYVDRTPVFEYDF